MTPGNLILVSAAGGVLTGLGAIFSSLRCSLLSADRDRVRGLAQAGIENAATLQELLAELPTAVYAMTLGYDASALFGTGAVVMVLLDFFSPGVATLLCLLFGFFFFGILGSLVPKAIFSHTADREAIRHAPLLAGLRVALLPLVASTDFAVGVIRKAVARRRDLIPRLTRDEILTLVRESEGAGEIRKAQGRMIRSVLDLDRTTAREVMSPRSDIIAVDIAASPEEIVRLAIEAGKSRILVHENGIDNIRGFIHVKDLLRTGLADARIRDLLRAPKFVPESKRASVLLKELQTTKTQMAVVVDEYGGTAGVVTFEDLVEEIMGDIKDEFDIEEPDFIKLGDNVYLVDAMVALEDAATEFGITALPEMEIATLGGFVIHLLGRMPKPKDEVTCEGTRFIIESTDRARIRKIRVIRRREG